MVYNKKWFKMIKIWNILIGKKNKELIRIRN